MADPYQAVRSLSFPALAAVLGIDLQRFKHQKNEWHGYCPVHQSKHNNNCFHYQDGTGKWHCFSCGAKGSGGIDLTKAVKDVSFQQAVEILGMAPKEPLKEKTPILGHSDKADGILKPYSGKYEKFKADSPWLSARIPDKAVLDRYGVFFYQNNARKSAYNNRVMVPFRDLAGVTFGYMGRAIEGEPKYLIPSGFPKSQFLFGGFELRQAHGQERQRIVYLVESPFSVLKFAMYGLPAVAAYGWSVSTEQADLLCSLAKGVIVLPDKNKYEETLPHLGKLGIHLWVRCPQLPGGIEDPEALDREAILDLTR